MLQYFREDEEMKDRFIKRALDTQRKIEDFGDFKDALFDGFSEGHGENASKHFDDEDVKFLFEDDKVKEKIADEIGEEKARELYDEVDKTGSNLFRAKPLGEKVSKKQVIAIVIEKPVKSKGYTRRGKTITPYYRSNKKWSPAQIKFIQVRKANGLKPKRIAYEYSQHFPKEEQRSESSITTKSYRI